MQWGVKKNLPVEFEFFFARLHICSDRYRRQRVLNFFYIFSLTALRLERLTNDLIKICLCANQLDSSAACKLASDETAEIARLQLGIIVCSFRTQDTFTNCTFAQVTFIALFLNYRLSYFLFVPLMI